MFWLKARFMNLQYLRVIFRSTNSCIFMQAEIICIENLSTIRTLHPILLLFGSSMLTKSRISKITIHHIILIIFDILHKSASLCNFHMNSDQTYCFLLVPSVPCLIEKFIFSRRKSKSKPELTLQRLHKWKNAYFYLLYTVIHWQRRLSWKWIIV